MTSRPLAKFVLPGAFGLGVWLQTAQAAPLEGTAKAQSSLKIVPGTLHLEAEEGQQTGTTTASSRAGFSGGGYVNGFDQDGDKIEFTLPNAKAGLYEVRLRYSSPGGEKGYDLTVNGSKISAMMPRSGEGFATAVSGKVELQNGANSVVLEKGWGYCSNRVVS